MGKRPDLALLSNEQIALIAETATNKAYDILAKEQDQLYKKKQKQERDWKLANTRLLLKNYRYLKGHCQADLTAELDEVVELNDKDDVFHEVVTLDTLVRYRARTIKIMDFVDICLSMYKNISKNGTIEQKRQCDILNDMYISGKPLTLQKIREKFYISKATAYRDLDSAISDMSKLIFGIENLGAL